MVSVPYRLYARASLPQRLQLAAVIGYVVMFAIVLAYGRPGLGIGQGFYVPIVLVSLAAGATTGAAAGLLATALYTCALLLHAPAVWADVFPTRIGIHLVTYVAAGAIVGYFASRARGMMSESLHVLEDLLHLARRDLGSGALNARGFHAALARRAGRPWPFALLVGELDCKAGGTERRRGSEADQVLRDAIRRVTAELGPEVDVARVGPSQVAVLASATTLVDARSAAAAVERALDRGGCRATFGWALHPAEGDEGLTLFRAATERLYARRIVRGEWNPTAASAELVDELSLASRPAV